MFHNVPMANELDVDALLTDREVGALLGVSRTTLWRLRQKGGLPFGKVGREFRYRKSEILSWVKDGRIQGVQMPLQLRTVAVARTRRTK
jgi:excisionase family DNA binding protein